MAKTNTTVLWGGATSVAVSPGARAYSDPITIADLAVEGRVDLTINGNGGGAESAKYVDVYVQYSADGSFENTPDLRRLFPIGSIFLEDTIFPKILANAPIDPVPAQFKLVIVSNLATDTLTISAIYREVT